jgi:hypothetical protein
MDRLGSRQANNESCVTGTAGRAKRLGCAYRDFRFADKFKLKIAVVNHGLNSPPNGAKYYHRKLVLISWYHQAMKPQPAPDVPGSTDAERFSNAVKMVLTVPPKAVEKEKKRMKQTTARRKQARETTR